MDFSFRIVNFLKKRLNVKKKVEIILTNFINRYIRIVLEIDREITSFELNFSFKIVNFLKKRLNVKKKIEIILTNFINRYICIVLEIDLF